VPVLVDLAKVEIIENILKKLNELPVSKR